MGSSSSVPKSPARSSHSDYASKKNRTLADENANSDNLRSVNNGTTKDLKPQANSIRAAEFESKEVEANTVNSNIGHFNGNSVVSGQETSKDGKSIGLNRAETEENDEDYDDELSKDKKLSDANHAGGREETGDSHVDKTRNISNAGQDNRDESIDGFDDRTIERILETYLNKSQSEPKAGGKDSKTLTAKESAAVSKLVLARAKRWVGKMTVAKWITKTGQYSKEAKHFLFIFHDSHDILGTINAENKDLLETQKTLAKLALESNVIIEHICELVIDIYQRRLIKYWTSPYLWTPLRHALGILWDYTDTSEEWTERVAKAPDFLTIIRKVLVDVNDDTVPSKLTEEEKWVLLAALEITHNISMVDSNIPILRKQEFTKALQPHLVSPDKTEHLAALSSLAGIVNEEESEIINSNKKVVKHLMKVFRKGLDSEERRYDGKYDSWNCKECALTIKRLARNDANKKLLVQLDALQLLVKLAKGSLEEQIEALSAIWALSFDEENRKAMTETEGLELITTLSEFQDSSTEKIKTAAHGTLWNLREDLRMSENQIYQNIGRRLVAEDKVNRQPGTDISGQVSEQTDRQGHIMISYSWSDKEKVIRIRNELEKQGLKVWMDIDQTGSRSTLEAMAEAVESANFVLVCFSQRYKNSPSCRAEVEYAFRLRKKIIPVKMESDYTPDGWLGFVIGPLVYVDFSENCNFKFSFKRLLLSVQRRQTSDDNRQTSDDNRQTSDDNRQTSGDNRQTSDYSI